MQSRSRRHEALVLTYVQPPNEDDAGNQWKGLRVMLQWLLHDSARCSCADVVVLVSKGVPPEQRLVLEQDGALVLEVSNPGIELRGGEDNWHFSWAKLVALGLTQYERVIVLDLDMVVLDRVESLFSWADEHFMPSCSIGAVADIEWHPDNPEGMFNAGVLLMFPSTTTLKELVR
jgi:alpha-N-acetylglucosamine transferase